MWLVACGHEAEGLDVAFSHVEMTTYDQVH